MKYSVLVQEHEEYAQSKAHLKRIRLLVSGGHLLKNNLGNFLIQRVGEEPEVWQNRLRKFSYSNSLGSGVTQLASKFSNGSVKQGRSERDLFTRVATDLIVYGKVFAHVERNLPGVVANNALEQKALGIRPLINLYDAVQVIDWSGTENRLDWVKIYHLKEESASPFEAKTKVAEWVIVDSTYVTTCRLTVKTNVEGTLAEYLNPEGKWQAISSNTEVPIDSQIEHGFGFTPVRIIRVDESLWAANQAYSKAEESLLLECHRQDILTNSYLQRIYTPHIPKDSLDSTTVDASQGPIDTRLESVLSVDDFQWREPKGDIVQWINSTLADSEKRIRQILALGGAYTQEATDASGLSKQMDFSIEESRLRSYGHVITDALQDIYQWVAFTAGESPEEITVSGLDDFSNDRLALLLEQVKSITEIDLTKLGSFNTAFQSYVLGSIVDYLGSNLTPEEIAIMKTPTLPEGR
jgi:hypothetical protein